MQKMKRAVAYARYSSNNQREESIEAQLRAIEKYCEDQGYLLVDTYKDSAISGKTDDRPAFQQMIKDATARSFDYVIVHKLDRFSRDRYDSAVYKRRLKKYNVKLLSVLENLGDSPEAIILESVIEGMNEYYSRNLSREVKKGMAENAYKGKFNGGTPPLGYDVDMNGEYIINAWEARAVSLIFDLYAQGYSYSQIMEAMNSRGFRTKRGHAFGRNSFYEILRNEKYIGTYIYSKEDYDGFSKKRNYHKEKNRENMIIFENKIPRIIDDSTWALVQIRRKENKRGGGGMKANRTYILSGRLVCSRCGEKMQGTSRNNGSGKTYYYYRCGDNTKTDYCKSINIDRIEPAVKKCFDEAIFNEKNKEIIITAIEQYSRIFNETNLNQNDVDYNQELLDTKREIKNIVAAISTGVTSQALLDRLEELEKKKETIKREIDHLIIKQEENTVLKERLRSFLNAHSSINDFTPEQQKTILSLFIENIVYDGSTISIHLQMIDPSVIECGYANGAGEGI